MTISILILLALGLVGALGLFVNLKAEVEKRSQKERANVEAILLRLTEWESRLTPATPLEPNSSEPKVLQPNPFELNSEPNLVVPRPGLNLSKRVQVTRLLREGKDSIQIAAELGLSRGEVQLLASVHNMAMGRATGAD
jgi:DNA-binding NarL/FixJ family response regulator